MLAEYPIIRSNRKTLCLLINSKAQLVVKAPQKMPFERINAFVQKKQSWIEKTQKLRKQKIEELENQFKELQKNREIWILGKKITQKEFVQNWQEKTFLNKKISLEKTINEQLEEILKERLAIFIPKIKLKQNTFIFLKVKKFKTKWGSCQKLGKNGKLLTLKSEDLIFSNSKNNFKTSLASSTQNYAKVYDKLNNSSFNPKLNQNFLQNIQKFFHNSGKLKLKTENQNISNFAAKNSIISNNFLLCFNLDLVHLPIQIIDYVITHELTHIIKSGHKEDFWDELSKIYPDHKIVRNWLKENSGKYIYTPNINS